MTYEGKGINRNEFNLCFNACNGVKEYELGAKPPLYSDSHTWERSDCSGFEGWIDSRCMDGAPMELLQGGSAQQHGWCRINLQPVPYSEALADHNNQIYICFMDQDPNTQEVTRHVWKLRNGATIECCFGEGVCTSYIHSHEYADRCSGCYLIPSYLE